MRAAKAIKVLRQGEDAAKEDIVTVAFFAVDKAVRREMFLAGK